MTPFQGKNVVYSLTIKRQVIKRILSGELNANSAALEYGIGGSMTIRRWLNRKDEILGTKSDDMTEDSQNETKGDDELQLELLSLRHQLKRERLRSEAYQRMIRLAEEKYKLPIEKKSGTKQ